MPVQEFEIINCYVVLGVAESATTIEITAAYRRRALETHPDRVGVQDAVEFRRVRQAYDTLNDQHSRRIHDIQLENSRNPHATGTGAGHQDPHGRSPIVNPFPVAGFEVEDPYHLAVGPFPDGSYIYMYYHITGVIAHRLMRDLVELLVFDQRVKMAERARTPEGQAAMARAAAHAARAAEAAKETREKERKERFAEQKRRAEREEAARKEKAAERKRNEEAAAGDKARRIAVERTIQEERWANFAEFADEVGHTGTMGQEKVHTCFHSSYCAKVNTGRKMPCAECRTKRGTFQFTCPHCNAKLCQMCASRRFKVREDEVAKVIAKEEKAKKAKEEAEMKAQKETQKVNNHSW